MAAIIAKTTTAAISATTTLDFASNSAVRRPLTVPVKAFHLTMSARMDPAKKAVLETTHTANRDMATTTRRNFVCRWESADKHHATPPPIVRRMAPICSATTTVNRGKDTAKRLSVRREITRFANGNMAQIRIAVTAVFVIGSRVIPPQIAPVRRCTELTMFVDIRRMEIVNVVAMPTTRRRANG